MFDVDLSVDANYKPISGKSLFFKKTTVECSGFDCETDENGNLICIASHKRAIKTKNFSDLIEFLWAEGKEINWFFNLKFDFSVMIKLYLLGKSKKQALEIVNSGVIRLRKYKIKFLEKTCFKISDGKKSKSFFDISSFYDKKPLAELALLVNEQKINLERDNLKRYPLETIKKYCIQDALITKKLGEKIIDITFKLFGKIPRRFYSKAYMSYLYLVLNGYADVKNFRCHKILLRRVYEYAYNSYFGGIFEIYRKGWVTGETYDINSAYPYVISQLPDPNCLTFIYCNDMTKEKFMKLPELSRIISFWKVKCNFNGFIPYRSKALNKTIYPLTKKTYEKYITGVELNQYIKDGLTVEFIDGFYSFPIKEVKYKLRDIVYRLYELKNSSDKKSFEYQFYKIVLNGIYGKFAQYKPKPNRLSNIVYASIMTAWTRVLIYNYAKQFKQINYIATDSINGIPLSSIKTSNELGGLKFEGKERVRIYQIGLIQRPDKTFLKFRGLFNIKRIEIKNNVLKIVCFKPVGLREGIIQHRIRDIGKFQEYVKKIDLKHDLKRLWINNKSHPWTEEEAYIWYSGEYERKMVKSTEKDVITVKNVQPS